MHTIIKACLRQVKPKRVHNPQDVRGVKVLCNNGV